MLSSKILSSLEESHTSKQSSTWTSNSVGIVAFCAWFRGGGNKSPCILHPLKIVFFFRVYRKSVTKLSAKRIASDGRLSPSLCSWASVPPMNFLAVLWVIWGPPWRRRSWEAAVISSFAECEAAPLPASSSWRNGGLPPSSGRDRTRGSLPRPGKHVQTCFVYVDPSNFGKYTRLALK